MASSFLNYLEINLLGECINRLLFLKRTQQAGIKRQAPIVLVNT